MQVVVLKKNKAFTKILTKYLDFLNIFLYKKALVLSEQINLNKHTIKFKNSNQLFYKLIYSLSSVKLESMKTYFKTYLKTKFIWFLSLL